MFDSSINKVLCDHGLYAFHVGRDGCDLVFDEYAIDMWYAREYGIKAKFNIFADEYKRGFVCVGERDYVPLVNKVVVGYTVG